MGCFDVWCALCGIPCWVDRFNDERVAYFGKSINWIKDVVVLLADNSVHLHLVEVNCNAGFRDKNGDVYNLHPTRDIYFSMFIGIMIHYDCYQFINKKYNHKLRFSDFPDIYAKPLTM